MLHLEYLESRLHLGDLQLLNLPQPCRPRLGVLGMIGFRSLGFCVLGFRG